MHPRVVSFVSTNYYHYKAVSQSVSQSVSDLVTMIDAIIELKSSYLSPPLCEGYAAVNAGEDPTHTENDHIRNHDENDKSYPDFTVPHNFQQELCHLLSRMNVNCVADVIDYTAIDFHQDYSSGIVTQTMVSFSHEVTSSLHLQTPDASPDGFFSADVLLRDCTLSLPGDDDEVTSHAMAYTLRSLVPVAPVRSLWPLAADDFRHNDDGNTLSLIQPLGVQFMMDTNSHELKLYSSTFGNRFLKREQYSLYASSFTTSWKDSIRSIQHDPVLVVLFCLLAIMAVIFFDVMFFLMENPSPKVGTYPFLLGSMRKCVRLVWYSIHLYGKVGMTFFWSLVLCVMDVVTFVRLVAYRSLCTLAMIRVLPSVIWTNIKNGVGYFNFLVSSFICSVVLNLPFSSIFGKRLLSTAMQSFLGFHRSFRSSFHFFLSAQYTIVSRFVFYVAKMPAAFATCVGWCLSLLLKPFRWMVSKIISIVTFPLRVFTKRGWSDGPTWARSKTWMTPQCKEKTPSYCPSICPVTFYKPRSNKSTGSEPCLDYTAETTKSPCSLKGVALFRDDMPSSSTYSGNNAESNKTKSSPSGIHSDHIRDIRDEHLLIYESHLHSSLVNHMDQKNCSGSVDIIAPTHYSCHSFDVEEKCQSMAGIMTETVPLDKVLNSCKDENNDSDLCEPISKHNTVSVELQEKHDHPTNDYFALGHSHQDEDAVMKKLQLCNACVQSELETKLSSSTSCLHVDVIEDETERNNSKNSVQADNNNFVRGIEELLVGDNTSKTLKEISVHVHQESNRVNGEFHEMERTNNLTKDVMDCSESTPVLEADSDACNVLISSDMADPLAKPTDSYNAKSVMNVVAHATKDIYSCPERSIPDDHDDTGKSHLRCGEANESGRLSLSDDGHHSDEDRDDNIHAQNTNAKKCEQQCTKSNDSGSSLVADGDGHHSDEDRDGHTYAQNSNAEKCQQLCTKSDDSESSLVTDGDGHHSDKERDDNAYAQNSNAEKCQQLCTKSDDSESSLVTDGDGHHSDEDRESKICPQKNSGNKPVQLLQEVQDVDGIIDDPCINQCNLVISSDIVVDNVGRVPSTSNNSKHRQLVSRLDSMSDARGILAAKNLEVNSKTINSGTQNDDDAEIEPHQYNTKISLSLNKICKGTTSENIENIGSTEKTFPPRKGEESLMTTGFQSLHHELLTKLKLRGKQTGGMQVSPSKDKLTSERDLSPCSKLQKTWELSVEMKAKPKKLKTPDVFLNNNGKKLESSNIQRTKRQSKNNVSQLVAKWSKDAVSPSQGSVDVGESRFRENPVIKKNTNTFPNGNVRLSKSKKIRPSLNYNDSCDEKSACHDEPLSFLNEMLG